MTPTPSSATTGASAPTLYTNAQIAEMSGKNGFEQQGRKTLFVDMLAQAAEDLSKPVDHPLHQDAALWISLRGPRRDCISFDMFCDMMDMADQVRDTLSEALLNRPKEIASRCQALDREQDFVRLSDVLAARYEHHDTARKGGGESAQWRDVEVEEQPASSMGMAA